jgi:hypothetical protein
MSTALLELAVDCLEDLAHEVAFLGGATVGLWITDPGAPTARATKDVDALLGATYSELAVFAARLRTRGF